MLHLRVCEDILLSNLRLRYLFSPKGVVSVFRCHRSEMFDVPYTLPPDLVHNEGNIFVCQRAANQGQGK